MTRSKRRLAATLLAFAALLLTCGCKKPQNDSEAIRAGITQHLSALSSLNLSAMDMEVGNPAIQGGQARVQVTFRPKNGAASGEGMQVLYQLEKRDSSWVVVKTEGVGGGMAHPPANGNPAAQPDASKLHGDFPNFRELIPSGPAPAGSTLPPGHPPIDAGKQAKSADSTGKAN